jgi:transcriptional regulator with XRE-family HTH domain
VLASRAGLARSYICDVERCARFPSLRNLSIIAGALEMPTSKVILETELKLAALIEPNNPAGLQQEIRDYYRDRIMDGIVVANSAYKFTLFNPAAERMCGMAIVDRDVEQWSEFYGCFYPDRITPFPTEELPLVRAVKGEDVHGIELFLRNEQTPNGRMLKIDGRALKNEAGAVTGGVILMSESA